MAVVFHGLHLTTDNPCPERMKSKTFVDWHLWKIGSGMHDGATEFVALPEKRGTTANGRDSCAKIVLKLLR